MGIAVHTTPFGPPAAARLRDLVDAAQGDDPLAPVTILVPTNSVGVGARRGLARSTNGDRSGVAGIQVVTLHRFAELLGAGTLASQGRRPATVPVIAAAIRTALADVPGCFAAVAHHEATEEALVTAHQRLADLDDEALDAISDTSVRTRDLVGIHRHVKRQLATGWYGRAELLDVAAAALAGHVDELGTAILHLPDRLEPPARRLIEAVGEHAELHVIAGLTGAERADAHVRELLGSLGGVEDPTIQPPVAQRVISVSDADEEVRSAVEIAAAAARDGTPFGRIAIVHPTPDPYGRLLHEHLAAERIPVAGAMARPLVGSAVGRFLLGILGLPDHDYARSEVMGALAAVPLQHGGRRPRTAKWEDLSREAGIVRGRDQWLQRLDRLHAETIARHDDATEEWRRRQLEWHVGAVDEFRGFIEPLLERVEQARTATTWSSLSDWALALLADVVDVRASHWPEVERRALETIHATVQRLAWLGELEPVTSLATFRRTLELELDTDLGRAGRLGDGVLVGPPGLAAGLDLDVVIVLGMAEGAAPRPVREDPLLQDEDRRAGGLDLAADRPHRQHRQVLAALAAGRQQAVLIQPRGDLRRSVERAPSRWLLDTANALGHAGRMLPESATWLETVPSFAARWTRPTAPATEQALRLALLAQGDDDREALLGLDRTLAAGLELTTARRGDTITRFDGDMRSVAHLLPTLTDPTRTTSASRLQSFVFCPHAYWARSILYVDEVEDPEEIIRISHMDRGSLVHEILEHFILSQIDDLPSPDEPWSPAARDRLLEIADDRFAAWEQRGVTGHAAWWVADRAAIRNELVTWLDQDDDRRQRWGVSPVSVEQSFRGDDAVRIELGDGRAVRVAGFIDRVDAGPERVLVVDYKTGSFGDSYRDLSPEDPTASGRQFQLPIYALAADPDDGREVEAQYWFCTDRGEWRHAGYVVDDDVHERFRTLLAAVADAHDHGVMPMRPTEPSTRRNWVDCAWCDPDGLGHSDRHRDWQRKSRDHATLGPLVRLWGLDAEEPA